MKIFHREAPTNDIILWGAWYGSHNIGDQLLLLTITDILSSHVQNVSFTVLTDSSQQIHHYMDPTSRVNLRILESRKQLRKVIGSLASGQLFLLGGGVPFFQSPKQVLVMSFLTGLARIFHTPYGTWCVASQPITSPLAKFIFRWILNGAAFITTRDNFTTQLFQGMGVRKPIEKVADSAFVFQARQADLGLNAFQMVGQRLAQRPLLALTPRTLTGSDNRKQIHYRQQSQQQYQQELDCFAAILDWSWESGYQPIFIPMNTFSADDDRMAAIKIIDQSKSGKFALLIDQEITPQEAIYLYSLCQASFVARVHGAVTSAIAGTPVMMYAFQPKHSGIMQSMGLEAYSLSVEKSDPNDAITLMNKLLQNRSSVQQEMQNKIKENQISALRPLQLLANILNLKK